jgi:nucleotide-binding universal stress UspA family protein
MSATVVVPRPAFRPGGLADLIVYQDADPASATAMGWATRVAEAHGASIVAMMFELMPAIPSGLYMESAPDVWMAAQQVAEREAGRVETIVRARLAGLAEAEVRRLREAEPDVGDAVARDSRVTDLIVIGWPAAKADAPRRRLFETVLFKAGRPVLLVPEDSRSAAPPKVAVVGWSGTREGARAVHDALPLLRGMEKVLVVSVDEPRGTPVESYPGSDLARHLARHGISAEARLSAPGGRSVPEVLAEEALSVGADLMVLGGYGHLRISEWMFGGVTRGTVDRLNLPTLFSH